MILAINGLKIDDGSSLRNAVGVLAIGTQVSLDLLRDGKRVKLDAIIGAADEAKLGGNELSNRLAGATLGEISERHPLAGRMEGVEVTSVQKGSPAAQAGLRKGDLITSINRQSVSSVNDVAGFSTDGDDTLLLHVVRDNSALFLVIR